MDGQDFQDDGKINHPLRWRHGGTEVKTEAYENQQSVEADCRFS